MTLDKHIIEQFQNANFAANFGERVCVFDLDKTYLDTSFETLWGLMKIPFEGPKQKKNIAGATAIARELAKEKNKRRSPFLFVSGSPKQMRRVILEKLQLDGVPCEAIMLKDVWTPFWHFQFKKMIDKIGFKLAGLLYAKSQFPENSYEILFGDDSEYDATVYSLYSDILDDTINREQLLKILRHWKIFEDEVAVILNFYDQLKQKKFSRENLSKNIYIHLEAGSTPNDHLLFSRKVTPTYNYFQTVILLWLANELTFKSIEKVLFELVYQYNFSLAHVLESLEDIFARRLISEQKITELVTNLRESDFLKLPSRWFTEIEKFFTNKNFRKKRELSDNLQISSPLTKLSPLETYFFYKPLRRLNG